LGPNGIRTAVVVVALAVGGGIAGVGLHARPQTQEQDAKSVQVLMNNCARCHPIDRVTSMRRSRPQWEEVITTMITARGAQVSDEDFGTILDYLVKEYGRVNVNRGQAEDLIEVLAISDKAAAAIVAYRKEHGSFEDFETLAKVPGVERDLLEKKRDAITF
jgi:competence ComEA-like helix-hairpin-helix protein